MSELPMHERSGNKSGLIWLILIVLVIAGGLYFHHSGAADATAAAIDETVDVFVPDAAGFQRRASVIGEARRVTDKINARHARDWE